MNTKQPEALRREYRATMPPEVLHLWALDVLACIASLEAQLEAVGAGGVGPLIACAGFSAADMATAAASGVRDVAAKEQQAGWVSVDERLPEPNTPVLLDIGKKFPIRALWAAKNTVRVGTDVDDWGEYDEETDEYYCPEGWYEWNEQEETHWVVTDKPLAWCALPAPSSAKGVAHG